MASEQTSTGFVEDLKQEIDEATRSDLLYILGAVCAICLGCVSLCAAIFICKKRRPKLSESVENGGIVVVTECNEPKDEISQALSAVPNCPLHEVPGISQLVLQRAPLPPLAEESTFINQFSDFVGQSGGEVYSPESDVSVTVPVEAISEGDVRQVFVNVGLDLPRGVRREGEIQLGPVVEVLGEWRGPVVIRIPHRALATSSWTLKAKRQVQGKWEEMEAGYLSWDDRYAFVQAEDEGRYTIVGKAEDGEEAGLRMCLVSWSNMSKNQSNYRVYCCHDILDVHKRVRESEFVFGGQQSSQAAALGVLTQTQDVEVALRDLPAGIPTAKVLCSALCYESYSTPVCLDFRRVIMADSPAPKSQIFAAHCGTKVHLKPLE